MIDGRCRICGKIYPRSRQWQSTRFCSEECRKKDKALRDRRYWKENRERLNEERRITIQNNQEKRIKHKDTMAEINEQARERGLTYGQMQGAIWCQKHPQIIKPKGWGKV